MFFPLVVDISIAVATKALVALRDRAAPGVQAAAHPAPTIALTRVPVAALLRDIAVVDAAVGDATAPGDEVAVDANVARVAAGVVAAGVTRKPVEVVQRILNAHHNGDPPNRIAKHLDLHHSVVTKVLQAAG